MEFASGHAESQKNEEPVDRVDSEPSAPTECAKFLLSAAFAFIAGYANVLSVRLYKVFATMMTGNAFMMGSELVTGKTIPVHSSWEGKDVPMRAWVFRIVIITAFCVGLLSFEFVAARYHRFGAATILAPPIAVTTLVCSLCFPERKRWHVFAMAVIFGIQHGVSSKGFGGTTTTVTGHLTKLAKALAKIRSRHDAADMSQRHLISIATVIFIITGAVFGELSVQVYQAGKISHLVLFVPVGPIMAVLLVINDHIFHNGDVDVVESLGSGLSWRVRYGTAADANQGDARAHQEHQKLGA